MCCSSPCVCHVVVRGVTRTQCATDIAYRSRDIEVYNSWFPLGARSAWEWAGWLERGWVLLQEVEAEGSLVVDHILEFVGSSQALHYNPISTGRLRAWVRAKAQSLPAG